MDAIAFYLQNSAFVEESPRSQLEAASQTRQEVEGQLDDRGLRERLRRRRAGATRS